MSRFKIKGLATIEIVTIVEAENEEEAISIASDRDIAIPCNGSELLGF